MAFLKFSKAQKACKEASNQKSSQNKLQLELTNIKNDFFWKFQKVKNYPKTPKNQKCHSRRPKIKRFPK